MGKSANLIGQTFGRLTVLQKTDQRKHRQMVWKCQCSCGTEHLATTNHLTTGAVKSCGCLKKEVDADRARNPGNSQHGGRRHAPSEYYTWGKIRGNRDQRWNDFVQFFCDVGERPSPDHELSRRDCTKPHSKENTYWRNTNDERAAAERLTAADLPEECTFDFRTYLRTRATA